MGALPNPALAGEEIIENDARRIPWDTVRRAALLTGRFPPATQPISRQELSRLRTGPWAVGSSALADRPASGMTRYLPLEYSRFHGDLELGWQELGRAEPGEAGLELPAGGYFLWEPGLEIAGRRWWAAASWRLTGRLWEGNGPLALNDPLAYPGRPLPAGQQGTRSARIRQGQTRGELTRLVLGYRHGGWSLAAGRFPARTGPGVSGALVLDRNAPSLSMVQVRRHTPLRWSGFLKPFAPTDLLFRAGRLSRREARYQDQYGHQAKRAHPWFFQWLMGWQPASFFRVACTQGTMATAREGTLWPDLMQVNFPLIGTTWREMESGPITDRIFAVQLELRWSRGPVPLLPREAGRAYWEYGGTDFLPGGPGGIFPELSIPASVLGVELVSRRWDLILEGFETQHPHGLWYSNSGYREGYTEEGTVLGHEAGGGAEGGLVKVALRPGRGRRQAVAWARHTRWDHARLGPGSVTRTTVGLEWGRNPVLAGAGHLWRAELRWNRERVAPAVGPEIRRDALLFLIRVSSY